VRFNASGGAFLLLILEEKDILTVALKPKETGVAGREAANLR
jgi:hypothetical protein